MDMIFYPHSLLCEGVHFPISFQKSFLDSSILHVSPIPNLRKLSFDHSFLSEGIDFFPLFNSFFYHPSLIYKSILCEGVAVALKLFFYYLVLLCHSMLLGTCYSTLIHSFGRDWFSHIFQIFPKSPLDSMILHTSPIPNAIRPFIPFWGDWFLCMFQQILLSIIVHCSINPCFWERVDVASQTFLLSSCIALSFHTTRKN